MKSDRILRYLAPILLFILLPLFLQGNQYYLHIFIICGINVILASSLRAITTTGQVSLGHGGFMCIGAYTSAVLTMKFGFPVYGAFFMGGLVAIAVAAAIAYPITRVKTVYFAMLTLFLGIVIMLIALEWRDMTGGSYGILDIPPLGTISIPGLFTIDFSTKFPHCYFILFLALLILLFLYRIERSYLGMTLKSIAQDEFLAASIGTNVANFKAIIFCVGCFCAGLAGSFYAHYNSVLTPGTFDIFSSIYIIVHVIVGGGKKFSGAIIGALVLTVVPEIFRVVKEFQPFVFVGVLFLVIFFLPEGLAGLPERVRAEIKRISKGRAQNNA